MPLRSQLGNGLALVAVGLGLLLAVVSPASDWTALLPGLIVGGIGIGLANPAIAGAALRVVDPARTGWRRGSATRPGSAESHGLGRRSRLGALLGSRIAASLAVTMEAAVGQGLANAVCSSGTRPLLGRPALAHAARGALRLGVLTTFC